MVRLGVLLPSRGLFLREGRPPDPGLILAMAELAEAHGFDSVWVGDSLTSKPRLEPLSVLAAVATRTHRVRLGTAVLLPALRPPVPLAHSIGTVDYLSRGRLVLGMGVGGAFTADMEREWWAAGVNPDERMGRLEETIDVLHQLWTGEEVAFKGKYFSFGPDTVRPLPVNGRIPILLACHSHTGSERQLRRAARVGDGIISITASPTAYKDLRERVWRYGIEAGRDPTGWEAAFYTTVNIGIDPGVAEAEAQDFLMKYYRVNHWGAQWGPFGHADVVAKRLKEYVAAGATTLIVRFASYRPLQQLDIFANEVLPQIRGGVS